MLLTYSCRPVLSRIDFMTRVFLATGVAGLTRAELPGDDVDTVAVGFDVRCMAADARAEQNVYAGTQGDGVLRSDDAGRTWRRSGLEGWVVKSLTISAAVPRADPAAGPAPPTRGRLGDVRRDWTGNTDGRWRRTRRIRIAGTSRSHPGSRPTPNMHRRRSSEAMEGTGGA